MNKKLLIVGTGFYATVAKEIAESMKCFDKIDIVESVIETAADSYFKILLALPLSEMAVWKEKYPNLKHKILKLSISLENGTPFFPNIEQKSPEDYDFDAIM